MQPQFQADILTSFATPPWLMDAWQDLFPLNNKHAERRTQTFNK